MSLYQPIAPKDATKESGPSLSLRLKIALVYFALLTAYTTFEYAAPLFEPDPVTGRLSDRFILLLCVGSLMVGLSLIFLILRWNLFLWPLMAICLSPLCAMPFGKVVDFGDLVIWDYSERALSVPLQLFPPTSYFFLEKIFGASVRTLSFDLVWITLPPLVWGLFFAGLLFVRRKQQLVL